ncbi:MBL fold metallo-hydrolase [Intrasporangium sp.]|uniref:MBL fold metallo-hydrolase n=1 Tax=Intrasporangium sp. TaxID=1925024 RepID=UPI002939C6B3|nr:MBL fold metallo-hydrolase [Intrasporangium sp.]MDV3223008.1 MBL fold metallo-hydrolase [Intrasporangium sp.]
MTEPQSKPFASSADLEEKVETVEILGEGVYALTAEGDPNVGAIEGEDFVVCFDVRATPAAARDWLAKLREHTDKPVRHVVLSHYHAVRVLGASAYGAEEIIAHESTRRLIDERGEQDWKSEFGRMPRLFKQPEEIPGLTHPTITFADELWIPLGGDRGDLILRWCGRGHTEGDVVAWVPKQGVLFAGDLVESQAALYTGDAYHRDWATRTLDAVASFRAESIVGGRGAVAQGREAVDAAIAQTRHFLEVLMAQVTAVHRQRGSLKDAFDAAHAALVEEYGRWPIFEHSLPFDVSRFWDELNGIERPVIWTAERDREVWDQLQR